MLFCAVKADAIVIRGRGYYVPSTATSYSTWTNAYMSYRTVWHDYQSNGVDSATNSIAYDHNPNFPLDATNLPASSEPVATNFWTNALGVVDYAYLFDGVNDFQAMGDSLASGMLLRDTTISMWIKMVSVKTTSSYIVIDSSSGNSVWALGLTGTNSGVFFLCRDGDSDIATAVSGNGLPTNEWVYVTGVRKDVTNVYIYTNGILAGAASNSLLGSVNTKTEPAPVVGAYDASTLFFNGYIDNLFLYDRAFSVTDITNEMWNTDHSGVNLLGSMESTNRNWSDITVPLMGLNMRSITGTQINDYTVNAKNATNNNATTEVAGTNEHNVINYAMRFDATNEWINANSILPEMQTAKDLTVCFWVSKNCLTNTGGLFSIVNGNNGTNFLQIRANGSGVSGNYGKVEYVMRYSGAIRISAITTSPVLTSNTYAFVAARFGQSGNSLNINNDSVALTHSFGSGSTTNCVDGIASMNDVRIGGVVSAGVHFNNADAAITEVLIFTNWLSNQELRLISQWTKPSNNLKVY